MIEHYVFIIAGFAVAGLNFGGVAWLLDALEKLEL